QVCVFFCQEEDGIRDFHVTGVQTCALPILPDEFMALAAEARTAHGLSPERGITAFGEGRPLDVRGWELGFDPEDPLDRAIQAARRTAFPEWGLDPFLD